MLSEQLILAITLRFVRPIGRYMCSLQSEIIRNGIRAAKASPKPICGRIP
jgi:hypothetical protein